MSVRKACKDCPKTFVLTDEDIYRFTRKTPTGRQLVLPERCEECRVTFREEIKFLAKPNLRLPQAQSGLGCFRPCSPSHAAEASSWPGASTNWSSTLAQAMDNSNLEVVRLSADDKVLGIAAITIDNHTKEVILGPTNLSPESAHYPGAERGFELYAIAESLRRGFGGHVSVPRGRVKADQAQRLVLQDAGVSIPVIDNIFRRHAKGLAHLDWWCTRIAREDVIGEQLNFLVLSHNISLNDIEMAVEQPKEFAAKPFKPIEIRRKLQGMFANMRVKHFFEDIDSKITCHVEKLNESPRTLTNERETYVDLLVTPSRTISLGPVLIFRNGATQQAKRKIPRGRTVAVETKAYQSQSYNAKAVAHAVKQVFWGNGIADRTLIAVTKDFWHVSAGARDAMVRAVTEAGGAILVMNLTALDASRSGKIFLDELESKLGGATDGDAMQLSQ